MKDKTTHSHKNTADSDSLLKRFWNSMRNRNYSPETIKQRKQSMNKFLHFLAERNIEHFHDVTVVDLETYRVWMREHKLNANTSETHLRAVRIFFNFLEKQSLVFENPATRIVLHKRTQKLPKVLTVKQVHQLLNAPDITKSTGIRDRAILELLYATGMRRREILSLTIFDIDLNAQSVRVLGKGRKERQLPCGKHATVALSNYLKHARPKLLKKEKSPVDSLWLNKYGKAFSMQMLNIIVRLYGRKAGLAVSTHTLRRCCATHMLQNGAHPLMVAGMLGHATFKTLSRYLRVTIADLKQTHRKSKPGK